MCMRKLPFSVYWSDVTKITIFLKQFFPNLKNKDVHAISNDSKLEENKKNLLFSRCIDVPFFRNFSKTMLVLKIKQIWYLLSFLDTLSLLWSHIIIIRWKGPLLESEPLYLYSCIIFPQPWFELLYQPRASTQGEKIDWRVHRKQFVFGKLGSLLRGKTYPTLVGWQLS